MNTNNHDNGVPLPAIEPSPDFVKRVTDRIGELEALKQLSRTQKRQRGMCLWVCLLGGAFLGWGITAPLLPPLSAAYYTLQCFAAAAVSLEIARWLPVAAVGIGIAALAVLAVGQLRRAPGLLRSTQA